MKIYDIYGLETEDYKSALSAIEQVINAKFEARESYYRGGTYYRCGHDPEKENFVIQRNFNPIEQEWNEEDFKQMKILLYVNRTEHADKLKIKLMSSIPGIVLLKRREVPEKPACAVIQRTDEVQQYSQVATI